MRLKINCLVAGLWILASAGFEAQAGAWVMPRDKSKLGVRYNSFAHDYATRFATIHAEEDIFQLFIEHGLTPTETLTFNYLTARRTINGALSRQQDLYELGVRVATRLQLGLLPPLTERIIGFIFPSVEVHRDRPTSLGFHIGFHRNDTPQLAPATGRAMLHEQDSFGYGAQILISDKLSVNRFMVLQEVDFAITNFSRATWERSNYRIQIGYDDKVWVGHEVNYFNERISNYRDIKRQFFIDVVIPNTPATLRIGRGEFRTTETPRHGKFTYAEVQYNF